MKNGFIYPLINAIIFDFEKLNLVFYFKKVGAWLNPDKHNPEKKRAYERVARDIFIVLKWIFVFAIWHYNINNFWITVFIWYLLITNLYTYFFHHIWCDEALNTENFDKHRVRNRFINLGLAVAYSDFCFAYLYHVPYMANYTWTTKAPTALKFLWFSVSNSFAANYDVIKPLTAFGNSVAMIQLIMTFIFVTIIISRSIPQTNSTT